MPTSIDETDPSALRSLITRWEDRIEQNRRAISDLQLQGYGENSIIMTLIRRETRELHGCATRARLRLHQSLVAGENNVETA